MKNTLITFAAVAVAAVALPTAAQAELSANLALTSKYKFRGQDQSDPGDSVLPAVQGGFDWEGAGFYAGNWNSSIGFGGGTEMDFYGGWKKTRTRWRSGHRRRGCLRGTRLGAFSIM